MYAFGGTDGGKCSFLLKSNRHFLTKATAIHISEEMTQPGRRVPQVIIMTMIIGLVTTLPLFIALMYFMTDLEAVSNSPLPSMELIFQA